MSILGFISSLLASFTTLAAAPNAYNGTQIRSIVDDKATYAVKAPFTETIRTFEAWIKLPKDIPDTKIGGIIFGNYYNSSFGYPGATDYLIDKNGNFRIYYNRTSGNTAQVDHVFPEYDFRTGKWEHIALTRNASTGDFILYVNGNKLATYNATNVDTTCTMKYQVGLDWTNWTKSIDGQNDLRYPFLGEIKSAAIYENILTATEIASDYQTEVIKEKDGLIASWNMNDWSEEVVTDNSGNGYDLLSYDYENYRKDIEEETKFDYSIFCIPDIQITTRFAPAKLDSEFDWIVANKDTKNIQYISFVGDLTDNCDMANGVRTAGLPQWNTVTRNFSKLDAYDISYGFVPGNHDYDDGVGRIRSCEYLNSNLPYSKYSSKDYFGGAYFAGAIENYYNIKRIDGVDYLFMNLEFGPRDNVLTWANRVVDEHPNHRIVVSTHGYMEPDGRITTALDSYAASRYGIGGNDSSNNADEMFDKFVKQHKNMFIVFSGHNSSDDIIYRTDKGVYGNTIHSFLIDAQGSFNSNSCDVLSMFKFNEGEKKAYVYWYSPSERAYLNKQNQFVIDFADEFNNTVGKARIKTSDQNETKKNIVVPIAISSALLVAIIPTMIVVKNARKEKNEDEK